MIYEINNWILMIFSVFEDLVIIKYNEMFRCFLFFLNLWVVDSKMEDKVGKIFLV